MGSLIYDFLTESILFSEKHLKNSFKNISIKRIEDELEEYRALCIKNKESLLSEINTVQKVLKLSPGVKSLSVDQLRQTAFYVDLYVLDDPLFKLTYQESEISKVAKEFIGFDEKSLVKKEVAKVIRFLKSITPFIAADYVKLFPISHTFEPPDKTPVYFPDDYYSNSLPEELVDWFIEKSIIRSMRKKSNEWIIEDKLTLSRQIYIRFKEHLQSGYFYHLYDSDFEIADEEKNLIKFRMSPNESPVDKETFQNWVGQSIISASLDVFNRLNMKVYLSSIFGCSYFTETNFEYELLNQKFNLKNKIQSNTYGNLLNLDIPFFKEVSNEVLMTLRQNEAEAFYQFRSYLDQKFQELLFLDDEKKREIKVESIIQEIGEIEIQKLNLEIKNIRKNFLKTALIATGEISLGLLSNHWLSVIGAAKGVTTFKDLQKMKSNPVFFLWKAKSKSNN